MEEGVSILVKEIHLHSTEMIGKARTFIQRKLAMIPKQRASKKQKDVCTKRNIVPAV